MNIYDFTVKAQDGSDVALHFDSYMNNDGTKGYLTCSYDYPLTFWQESI